MSLSAAHCVRLNRVALLRELGLDWPAVAHDVGSTEAKCRQWRLRHADAWAEAVAAARVEVAEYRTEEKRRDLRRLLRDGNPREAQDAAEELLSTTAQKYYYVNACSLMTRQVGRYKGS